MTDLSDWFKTQKTVSTNGVCMLSDPQIRADFEMQYLKVREKEGRILNDEMLKLLPDLPKSHVLAKEWAGRRGSLDRFLAYLLGENDDKGKKRRNFQTILGEIYENRQQRKSGNKTGSILEVGCGNGWFANQLAATIGTSTPNPTESSLNVAPETSLVVARESSLSVAPDANIVVALDVNRLELEQGAKVFSRENLLFCYGDLFEPIFPAHSFDLIVLNASVQYFPDLKQLFGRLRELLQPSGEIHLMDSPFYIDFELEDAKERSLKYYKELGFNEMAKHYHHHSWQQLRAFQPEIMHDPRDLHWELKRWVMGWFGKTDSTFPWIKIPEK